MVCLMLKIQDDIAQKLYYFMGRKVHKRFLDGSDPVASAKSRRTPLGIIRLSYAGTQHTGDMNSTYVI